MELDDSESKKDGVDDLGINNTEIRELLLQEDVGPCLLSPTV